MDAKAQAQTLIKYNESADDKNIVLMIPQEIDALTIKNALISLYEYVTIFANDKVRAEQAEAATKKAAEPAVEVVEK